MSSPWPPEPTEGIGNWAVIGGEISRLVAQCFSLRKLWANTERLSTFDSHLGPPQALSDPFEPPGAIQIVLPQKAQEAQKSDPVMWVGAIADAQIPPYSRFS